jgi:hypothetical protein
MNMKLWAYTPGKRTAARSNDCPRSFISDHKSPTFADARRHCAQGEPLRRKLAVVKFIPCARCGYGHTGLGADGVGRRDRRSVSVSCCVDEGCLSQSLRR